MTRTYCLSLLLAVLIGCAGPETAARNRDPLVTGRSISPTTTQSQDVGSVPINFALSSDGKYLLSTDIGWHQWLWSIRTADGQGVSNIHYANPKKKDDPTSESLGLYYGLAVSSDNTIYASQGGHDSIAVLKIDDQGKLIEQDSIAAHKYDFPAGLALDDSGHLYVANNAVGDENPYKLSGSVAIYDTASKTEVGRYAFASSHGGTSNFPLGIVALHDGSKAYVAAERDDAVYVLNTRDPSKPLLAATLPTGAHPVSLLLNADQSRLFVSNSLSDTISVVDTSSDKIVGTVLLRPQVVRDLPGVTPLGMTLSKDQNTLYVALGDMNAIAVIDVDDLALRGYIPAGWYPTSLAISEDGNKLFVANGKGLKERNPNNKTDPHDPKHKTGASLSVLEGNVSLNPIPKGEDLKEAMDEVLKNNRLDELAMKPPSLGAAQGKIKHVIYVIKENRTYDQVLGDMPQGNGDASLAIFGKNITPNQHALAERFVLLDNLYACGEVSGDGWTWSTQGMADAYVERNIPYHYSHRGRKYDYEGQNNGYPTGGLPTTDPDGKPLSPKSYFAGGTAPIPDVASTGTYLWDVAKQAGITWRNYGFLLYITDKNAGFAEGPDNYPAAGSLQPAGHNLEGQTDIDYRRFDLDYPDSDAPSILYKQTGDADCLFKKTGYGKFDSPSRFSEWNREFQMMLMKDPTGGAVPAMMMVRFPTDHTEAARSGKHSPRAYLADNDYAVGQLVETVSKSAIWKDTAIIVVEDDAQSGSDHVDCHRMPGYIISPWIKQGSVDHHFYNTDSVLKTIELLLGLKPLCQYDAIADPIMDWSDGPTNAAAYQALMPSKGVIAEMNPEATSLQISDPRRKLAELSEAMDFSHADAAPTEELNEIVWQTVRGVGSQMPEPRHTLTDDKDDD